MQNLFDTIKVMNTPVFGKDDILDHFYFDDMIQTS